MKCEYFQVYHNFDLIHNNLIKAIQAKFQKHDLQQPKTYQELLIVLDQKCQAKANRAVSKQIFEQATVEQAHTQTSKISLRRFINKYIESLQTSKLCLIRQEAKQKIIQNRLTEANKQKRKKTYIFLKVIQVTIHSRYSSSPCFQYQITPSNIPKITVVNSLNPILNHEYALQLENDYFYLQFYQSGVQIYKWKFQANKFNSQGEYFKSLSTEAVTFEVQIKHMPKGTNQQLVKLNLQKQQLQSRLQNSKKAFQSLCFFQPFLQTNFVNKQKNQHSNKDWFHNFTQSMFNFLPFMRRHLKILQIIVILFIFVQCLASISWAVQFIDIIIGFSLLGLIYDRSKPYLNVYLWPQIIALVLCIVKSIWGAFLKPFGVPKYPQLLILGILWKFVTIFFIWICTIRQQQIGRQRQEDIYMQKKPDQVLQLEQNNSIFKANSTYFRNKQLRNYNH